MLLISSRLYDRENNDTYTRRYSLNPAHDAEVHMYRHERGPTTLAGEHGFYSGESAARARNAVLQFHPPHNKLLTYIKNIKVKTLMPMSLLIRYERNGNHLAWEQSTPVYYDTKLDKFVLLMDVRFLRDTDYESLGLQLTLNHQAKHGYKIYESGERDDQSRKPLLIGVHFSSIEAIKEASDNLGVTEARNPLSYLHDLYAGERQRMTQGTKILLIRALSSARNRSMIVDLDGRSQPSVISRHFGLEFTVAYKFDDRYYLADEQGEIDKTRHFRLNKAREQGQKAPNDWQFAQEKGDLIILEYSADQHNVLLELSSRLQTFHDDLQSIFKQSIASGSDIDAPLHAVTGLLGHDSAG